MRFCRFVVVRVLKARRKLSHVLLTLHIGCASRDVTGLCWGRNAEFLLGRVSLYMVKETSSFLELP